MLCTSADRLSDTLLGFLTVISREILPQQLQAPWSVGAALLGNDVVDDYSHGILIIRPLAFCCVQRMTLSIKAPVPGLAQA